MTQKEADILAILEARRPGWSKPRHVGGKDSSGHSVVLTRMVPKGWVERRGYWGGACERATWEYRITPKGRQALANHRLTARVA